MTEFQTYIACIKGNCGACVLFIPKAYANGGLLFSNFAMIFMGTLLAFTSVKLVYCGQKMGAFSYSEIVLKAFGPKGKMASDIMVFGTQYSFTFGSIAF